MFVIKVAANPEVALWVEGRLTPSKCTYSSRVSREWQGASMKEKDLNLVAQEVYDVCRLVFFFFIFPAYTAVR